MCYNLFKVGDYMMTCQSDILVEIEAYLHCMNEKWQTTEKYEKALKNTVKFILLSPVFSHITDKLYEMSLTVYFFWSAVTAWLSGCGVFVTYWWVCSLKVKLAIFDLELSLRFRTWRHKTLVYSMDKCCSF